MIRREKVIVMDIDGTICPIKQSHENYADLEPYPNVVERMRHYQSEGFYIVLQSSRNMNTFDGNLGLITANTAKVLFRWLEKHQIPHDEVHLGKPWAGRGGFYVDDKAIRPSEFLELSYQDVLRIVDPTSAEASGKLP